MFIDDGITHLIDLLSHEVSMEFEIIADNELAAIISHNPDSTSVITREVLLCYANIIDRFSQLVSLIPMRFGSVVPSISDVINLLYINSASILKVLTKIRNTDEYSLRFLFSTEPPSLIPVDAVDVSASLPGVLHGDSEIKKYLREKYKRHITDENRLQYIENVKTIFISSLQTVIQDVQFKKTLSTAFILDAVLLVEKAKKDQLLSFVKSIQFRYPEHNVILTGPWPPYNFSQINIP